MKREPPLSRARRHTVHNSNINYVHVTTERHLKRKNDCNSDYKPSRSPAAKQTRPTPNSKHRLMTSFLQGRSVDLHHPHTYTHAHKYTLRQKPPSYIYCFNKRILEKY